MNTFDLQIQSAASDGKHAPREIVSMAKEQGVGVIALTDHDTVAGVPEALGAGRAEGIRVIPGIELSVEERGAHILSYGVDYTHPALLAALEEFRLSRIEGAKAMVRNLERSGFAVSWEDVERQATGGLVARPHIARAILGRPENKEKLDGAASVHDFIEAFLSNESPNYVPRAHVGAREAIALIGQAGGIAVWSHPAIHFQNDPEGLEMFLRQLLGWGLAGVEAFNPSHTGDDAEFLHGLAEKYKILRTGGSDFHERGEHPANERGLHSARTIGDFETHGFPIDDIIARLDEALAKRKGDGGITE